jgi:hypothetical protein
MIQGSILKNQFRYIALILLALFMGTISYSQKTNYSTPKIDHILIAVRNLGSAKAEYEKLGFTVVYAGSPKKALNALIFLKDGTAIELIGQDRLPFIYTFLNKLRITRLFGKMKDRVAAFRDLPTGLFNYCLYSDNLNLIYQKLKQNKIKVDKPVSFSRLRNDLQKITWKLDGTFPYDLPFFIENYTPSRLSDSAFSAHGNKAIAINGIVIETSSFDRYYQMYNVIYNQIPKIILDNNMRMSTYILTNQYVVLQETPDVRSIFTKDDKSAPVRFFLRCEKASEIKYRQVNSFITLEN